MRTLSLLAAGVLALAACGSSGDGDNAAAPPTATPAVTTFAVTASDYAFDAPASIRGGRVDVTLTNAGKEPHFAGFAKVADGKTAADVRAALTTPPGAAPAGPPPFVDYAGAPTTDPGLTTKLSLSLPNGTYVLFCVIPARDGTPHAAKGMLREVVVTDAPSAPAALPTAEATVTGTDFALTPPTGLTAASTALTFRNDGKQLHEVNLVELRDGTDVKDVVAWYAKPSGPPPMASVGGVAVKPGETGVAFLSLRRGARYAFVCAIPDVLGDMKPHLTKGMWTPAFTA